MIKPTLVILAAGMGSRYGGLKQLDEVGPGGETIMDFSVFDAARAGFGKVVFVIREDFAEAFKAKIGEKFRSKIDVDYVFQAVNTPILGFDSLPERTKPWGTGHAVLVAAPVVDTPFCVINADDYYGVSAFAKMSNFLQNECTPEHYAMIGYRLQNTLSDNGTVSRGVCHSDDQNNLTTVVEHHKIAANEAGIITGELDDQTVTLAPDAIVSMNFWGFHQSIFGEIRNQFRAFVAANREHPTAEFYIPSVVNTLIEEGKINSSVRASEDRWYGVTYREDKETVTTAFETLAKEEVYPNPLWT